MRQKKNCHQQGALRQAGWSAKLNGINSIKH